MKLIFFIANCDFFWLAVFLFGDPQVLIMDLIVLENTITFFEFVAAAIIELSFPTIICLHPTAYSSSTSVSSHPVLFAPT